MRRERDALQEQLQTAQSQRSSLTQDNHKLNLALQVIYSPLLDYCSKRWCVFCYVTTDDAERDGQSA